MADDPRVFGLLEDMLDSGMTPEEACRDCPDLVQEVRERWKEFCQVDATLAAIFPGLQSSVNGSGVAKVPLTVGLPEIPGYYVDAILGYGGMGVVYKARQRALDRVVAVKMLLAGPFASPLELGRFRRETTALACLKHPNIVQVYDAGDVEGRPYLTMELIEGGSLAQKLSGTPQPARDVAKLVATLARAVEVAHQAGIVHRDLKPVNILLAADGTPKVTDFGLARRVEGGAELTQTGVTVGTPNYMAPEQARGQAEGIGTTADVYALGAILYEMLTGRPPFRGETPAETVRQVIDDAPVPPGRVIAAVPRDLETICLKCLDKDPKKRYATAALLNADLERFLKHEPIHARPIGRMTHVVRWMRRRPAAAGLIAAVILLLLLGGIGGGLQYQQRAATRNHREQTDQEVRTALAAARGALEEAWKSQDLVRLATARAEANRAVDIARSGAASPAVLHEAETFREDVNERSARAKKNRDLREAVLDVADPLESVVAAGEADPKAPPAQPTVDEQYAAAFRPWGLDVDHTPEAEAVARLGSEPDTVVQEVIAALDGWMLERRRQKRPEVEWRRLFHLAERLDRSDRHRWLRALLVREAPPRPASVAALVGTVGSLPALWELACGDDWRHLRDVRQEIDPRAAPVLTVVLLAQAYAALGDPAGAEQLLREAATARPDQIVLLDALGKLLERQEASRDRMPDKIVLIDVKEKTPERPGASRHGTAIEFYRAARALRPRLGIALSAALLRADRPQEAEGVLRDLIRQGQESPTLQNYLGVCLDAQKKHGRAEAAYLRALALAPNFVDAQCNLGMCLADQERYVEAERVCRRAVELRPDRAIAHYCLGQTLHKQMKYAAAAEAFHRAVTLRPDWAEANYNFGNELSSQGKHAAAEAAYRQAIALRPDFALAHNNLGMALKQQQKPGSEAAFCKAVDLRPDFLEANNNLGTALAGRRRYGEAEAPLRRAVALRPDFAMARFNLGFVLGELGRFNEALAVLNEGSELLSAGDPLRQEAKPLLLRYQRCMALEPRLPSVLKGTEKPANATEQIGFAELCQIKTLYAAAAQFYADAFGADPNLAEDLPSGRRYSAACAATLAGNGQGEDADKLTYDGRARWRRQAREWLRRDLTVWSKSLDNQTAKSRAKVLQHLHHWQADDDLAGIRDSGPLGALPQDERQECLALWEEIAAILDRTQTIE